MNKSNPNTALQALSGARQKQNEKINEISKTPFFDDNDDIQQSKHPIFINIFKL